MNADDAISEMSLGSSPSGFSGWSAERVVIGRIRFERVRVGDRTGAINFIEAMNEAIEKTKRTRHRTPAFGQPLRVCNQGPTRLLSEAIRLYQEDQLRRRLSASSLDATAHSLSLLLAAAGDIPVSKVDQDHIRKMWDFIRWWPRSARGQKKYRGMSVQQIVEAGKANGVPSPSIHVFNAHWGVVQAFFNRLVATKVLVQTPLEGLDFKIDTSIEPKVGRAFTHGELCTIFNPDTYFPWARQFPHRWWVPILGLYTGARVNELSQLKVSDIGKVGDIWTLRIHKTFDERVDDAAPRSSSSGIKCSSSVRSIPIAQPLLDAGFLAFVSDVRATKHPRLFPHLGLGRRRDTGVLKGRGYGTAMTEQFCDYTNKIGIEKGVAMHAFRHTFSTALRIAKVPDSTVAAITGHSPGLAFPVLRKHYQHIDDEVMLREAAEAISMFDPNVEVPRYTPGQFKQLLAETWRFQP